MPRFTLQQIRQMERAAAESEAMVRAEPACEQEDSDRAYWQAVESRTPPPRELTINGTTFETVWYPHREARPLLPPRSERTADL